jgi:predicted ester cyclase
MSTERHKMIVHRYFGEMVDRVKVELAEEFFTEDCVIHRPEAPEPIIGLEGIRKIIAGAEKTYSELTTTIHDLIAEEDRVVCRLSHSATYYGDWVSRIGKHSVGGKRVNWSSIAIFRIRDGKIAEEWVCRDELGMLLQIGVLTRTTESAGV